MPIHSLFQLKQIVTLGERHYNCFRNLASYIIWLSFASLMCWIAIFLCNIPNLKVYVDDNASFTLEGGHLVP